MVASNSPILENRNVGRRPKTGAMGKTRKFLVRLDYYPQPSGRTDTDKERRKSR